MGASGSYDSGWFNTSKTRSVGWHHARIVVGPPKSPSNTNDVTFYIDDMTNSVLATKDSTTTTGFNTFETNTMIPKSGNVYSTTLHWMDFDNIALYGSSPVVAPTAAPAVPGWTSGTGYELDWNWTETPSIQSGSNIYDAATAGALKKTVVGTATTWAETGLTPNTQYSRWVTAFGPEETDRVALPPTFTWAAPPTADVNVTAPPSGGYTSSIAFTNPQGFGIGNLVSAFGYMWSTDPGATLGDDAPLWSGGVSYLRPRLQWRLVSVSQVLQRGRNRQRIGQIRPIYVRQCPAHEADTIHWPVNR